jgi:hypothetical protein
MISDETRERPPRLDDELLVAEAELAAAGWRFVTIDGLTVESETDLDLYEEALFAFDAAAGSRQSCHASSSSRLTFGIRGADAQERVKALRARLEELNPPGICGGRRWQIRDGGR